MWPLSVLSIAGEITQPLFGPELSDAVGKHHLKVQLMFWCVFVSNPNNRLLISAVSPVVKVIQQNNKKSHA